MANYLKIKKASLIPDNFGKHIKITMIGEYDESGKWIKWVKLDHKIIDLLIKIEIYEQK